MQVVYCKLPSRREMFKQRVALCKWNALGLYTIVITLYTYGGGVTSVTWRMHDIRHMKGRITSVTWRMHNIRHVKDVWHHAEKMHGAQQQQQSVVARPWNRTVAGVIRAVLSHPLHPTFCWKAQFAGPPKSCWFINVDGLWWHRLFVEALEVLWKFF